MLDCFSCDTLPGELVEVEDPHLPHILHQVQCVVCGARGPTGPTEKDAIHGWNSVIRADPTIEDGLA